MNDETPNPYSPEPGPESNFDPEQPAVETRAGGEPQPPAVPVGRPTRRRAVATMAAGALVLGGAGLGAGYAVGHATRAQSSQSASSPQSTNFDDGSSGDGTQAIPGNPGWRWSTGGGSTGQAPTDPFGDGSGGSGGSGGGLGGGSGSSPDTTSKASASQVNGLVRIVSTMKYAGAEAAGTGMILTSSGEVVTNHHVVEGATSVKVTVMSTGKSYTAKVVGTDAKDDVAVLQLNGASGLSTVQTDTGTVSKGDKVTAVGDANGTTNYLSAASGKVRALNQSITTQSEGTAKGERLTGLIEISSDVVSGDSGGATYDADGKVVGMTTAASSGGEINGYAVPITKVLSVVDDLESGVTSSSYRYGAPAFLGVGLSQTGTTVAGVYQGTPAAQAGIAAGDKITEVDGTSVSSSTALHKLVAGHSVGDKVSVTWTDSSGSSHTATVTLIAGPIA
jgi:S1-C subfamily serine protease